MKTRYEVIRKGSGFTAVGPTPDVVLSRHGTYEAAQRAFSRANGPCRIVEITPQGRKVLDAAIC